MLNNLNELKEKFKNIKNNELNESLRSGSTGIGFTFENLIGKKEDSSFQPDFKGIEIKTKLGHSNSPMTLFCLTPTKDNDYAIKYILKLKISKIENKLYLLIYNVNLEIINNKIYWNLDILKERLTTKLNYLALIKGYRYLKNNKVFYKYTSLTMYKLKNFDIFLKLIENNKVFITFNIGTKKFEDGSLHINDRGTAFRIQLNCINELFEKIE